MIIEIKPKILIVDDIPSNLVALERILVDMNVDCIRAKSGNEALSHTLSHDFALIISDVQMPIMDGFELAELLRSNLSTRNIPIIFLTATNKEEKHIFQGYELGAVDYLFKPIDATILKSKVRIFVNLYQQQKKAEHHSQFLEEMVIESKKNQQELEIANKQLTELSTLDSLTNIANRRTYDHFLKMAWDQSIVSKAPISVIMLDIDYFKLFNDEYGHQCGDECLKKVAEVLKNRGYRATDLVARYGGEEFIIVLGNTNNSDALKIAENVRLKIEALRIPHQLSLANKWITASIGVSTIFPTINDSIKSFIQTVDKSLYLSKEHGRNQVSFLEHQVSQT